MLVLVELRDAGSFLVSGGMGGAGMQTLLGFCFCQPGESPVHIIGDTLHDKGDAQIC